MSMTILLIGAADTGRTPMAAAILRHMLAAAIPDCSIVSAGVVGHDGDPAEPEARNAMAAIGLDIQDHRASLLTDAMVATATVLLCIDTGIARVVRTRYPQATAHCITLGELAGQPRDIPDPFRMQIGAWMGYAREIEAMLRHGMPRLIALMQGKPSDPQAQPGNPPPFNTTSSHMAYAYASATSTSGTHTSAVSTTNPHQPTEARQAAIARCDQLLALIHTMPHMIAWEAAHHQLDIELQTIQHTSSDATELVQPYVAMLQALLNTTASMPHPGQINLLRLIIARLNNFIDAHAIATLSNQMIHWSKITP